MVLVWQYTDNLPPEMHFGTVMRSKVSQALAFQIIGSLEDILAEIHLKDEQRVQCRQVGLRYAPYTNTSNARNYHMPSMTQELTVKSVNLNCAYSSQILIV
jgi:hypothetical protein